MLLFIGCSGSENFVAFLNSAKNIPLGFECLSGKKMNCPKCEREMESGYFNIYSPKSGSFLKTIIATYWKDSSKENKEKLQVISTWLNASTDLEGYRCRNCNLIVFSYVDTDRDPRHIKSDNEFNF